MLTYSAMKPWSWVQTRSNLEYIHIHHVPLTSSGDLRGRVDGAMLIPCSKQQSSHISHTNAAHRLRAEQSLYDTRLKSDAGHQLSILTAPQIKYIQFSPPEAVTLGVAVMTFQRFRNSWILPSRSMMANTTYRLTLWLYASSFRFLHHCHVTILHLNGRMR